MDKRIYNTLKLKEPTVKGYSKDKKYLAVTAEGIKFFLRIAHISRYENHKLLFSLMKQISEFGIPMCFPLEFGICDEGVYSIQSWIDGERLTVELPALTHAEQYAVGLQSGDILRKIHNIRSPDAQENWTILFNKKVDENIMKYHCCETKIDGYEHFVDYIDNNRRLLENRPQCFLHGDYHTENMMIANGELTIIDFERYDFGDPWNDFARVVFSARKSPHFATGQLNGYFCGEPP